MADIGLVSGVKALWQEDLLSDYTLIVEGQEFKAHKVVLASVSYYFKAMLSEGFSESETDEVELKGLCPDVLSKLLEFIYTGNEDVIRTDTLEVLKCTIYLQMPLVADVCVEKLLDAMNHKNCLELYSVLLEFSMHGAVRTVEKFIKKKLKTVLEFCNLKELSLDKLQVLRKYWKESEWEMFLFIKDWFEADPENHHDDIQKLLSDVRFCLINPQRLEAITEMDFFHSMEGPWHALVEQALPYHQLPTHLRVLEQSEQSKVRSEPSPTFFTTEDASTFFALDEKSKWKKYDKQAQNVSELTGIGLPGSIEVNNYLIICSGGDRTQTWHIFDPRRQEWSKMADMNKWKGGFVVLHHGEHLYVVGGSSEPDDPYTMLPGSPSYEMEQYSFRENSWSSVTVPYAFKAIGGCFIGDCIYVCGGTVRNADTVDRSGSVYSLDLSSPNQDWVKKARFTILEEGLHNHRVFTVRRGGEDVMVAITNVDYVHMHFYSPSRDQWTDFVYTAEAKCVDSMYKVHGMMLVKHNYFYILNIELYGSWDDGSESDDLVDTPEEHYMRARYCLKWRIPKAGQHIKNVPVEKFPLSPRPFTEGPVNIFGAILAIPY